MVDPPGWSVPGLPGGMSRLVSVGVKLASENVMLPIAGADQLFSNIPCGSPITDRFHIAGAAWRCSQPELLQDQASRPDSFAFGPTGQAHQTMVVQIAGDVFRESDSDRPFVRRALRPTCTEIVAVQAGEPVPEMLSPAR